MKLTKPKYQHEKKTLIEWCGDFYPYLKEHNAIIAGGAVTSVFTKKDVNDLDVYFRSKEDLIGFFFDIEDTENRVVYMSDKAVCILNQMGNIQVVFIDFYETPEAIFEAFDFTCVMGAFDFKEEEFVLHDDFLLANSQRRLTFNDGTLFPLMSMLRAFKYQDRGYSISKMNILRILATCMTLEIDTWAEARRQIGGMYGLSVDKILPDTDTPFSPQALMDRFAEVDVHDDYFKTPSMGAGTLPRWDEIVAIATNHKFRGFKAGGKSFYWNVYGDIRMGQPLTENIEWAEAPELVLYKALRINDDQWVAPNHIHFVYNKTGETRTDNERGLYFFQTAGEARQRYQTRKHVIVAFTAKWEDVIRWGYEIQVKGATFSHVVEE